MATGYLQKRGKVWYARYRDESGRERWKSLETNSKEIAQAKLSKVIEAVEKHEVGWRLQPKPLHDYLLDYLAICEAEHSPKTYRNEKQILYDFIKFCSVQYLHQVTADRVEAYKVKRAREVSKSTVNRCITVVKACFNRAMALGFIERNPGQFIKKLKEEQQQIKFLGDEEIRSLLEASSPRVRQIITVFLHTGLRICAGRMWISATT